MICTVQVSIIHLKLALAVADYINVYVHMTTVYFRNVQVQPAVFCQREPHVIRIGI